ncbi:MAG: alpha/beta hydrolase [Aeromicrobium sp.]
MSFRSSRRRSLPLMVLGVISVLVVAVLTLGWSASADPATRAATRHHPQKPTIVLVHGAFADASGWNRVSARLQKAGYTTYAPPNTLRGPLTDSEYLRSFLSTIDGPIVLVGHSYGGALITNASTGNPNVKALVYVAAYALDEGESVLEANELGGGTTDLAANLVVRPYPGAPAGDGDAYIDPAAFRRLFAQDLSKKETRVMAAAQRPAALSGLVTPSGVPGWKTIPSYYLVASQDRTIPPAAERAMAKRAHAKTIEIRSSHVAMMSHPKATTRLIIRAARGR